MRVSARVSITLVAIAVLAGLAVFGNKWYHDKRVERSDKVAASHFETAVTSAADRGPGSLREALFVAAGARTRATIEIRVPSITLETALPPVVNPNGIAIMAPQGGAAIDAGALQNSPVFDVAGPNTSIVGLTIRNCSGPAVLLRASQFRMASSVIESCDVGVDVAENANDLSLTHNRFTGNRVGVRFAASSQNASVVNNTFSGHKDAGVWAVRSSPDLRSAAIDVRDNKFSDDRMGVVAGNVSLQLDHNEILGAHEAAIHMIGTGVVARRNRVSGGAAMGIIAENAKGATIESNELDHVTAYAVMVRGSSNTLVRDNRIHNCGYGLAFVLGDSGNPSTAAENSIIEPRYNGIDVIGDSPILRRNRVLNPRALALHVQDFKPPGGQAVKANPFLQNNDFGTDKARIAFEGTGRSARERQ
jgi:parallel beta-helix repeat protein